MTNRPQQLASLDNATLVRMLIRAEREIDVLRQALPVVQAVLMWKYDAGCPFGYGDDDCADICRALYRVVSAAPPELLAMAETADSNTSNPGQ